MELVAVRKKMMLGKGRKKSPRRAIVCLHRFRLLLNNFHSTEDGFFVHR